ncbi:MAG: 2-C-methyl-D-erythritol 2,4-cyclodiphosphate synthase [Bacteroidales bacterium]|jgi:2-C-methyl-D-erythritol 2,4-cyclodiphosphate synthase|nr:2-C-methyl-D-erythritol 2,4-cyclodiphosphate synthase [Bacteroidales bacterium]MDD4057944.1 2-C-methyl-D-erythritol 2,4-cyclodiphosphate synthase [Bacteroidales bacterium]
MKTTETIYPQFRIGNGYDVHRLAPRLPLWICGIKLPHEKGCVAHSDGDTPLHALCDAILGALALGDIGKHFPDSSNEYSGIDSKILLKKVNILALEQGWVVGNCDITIALQRPKIAPYIQEMRSTIAGILNIDLNSVSVKATTTEKLGFVGREEGIESWATVLMIR